MWPIRNGLRRVSPFVLATALASTAPAAQSIQTLLLEGDSIIGTGGTLVSVTDLYVADDGQWMARTVVDTGAGSIEAALLNGAAVLLSGDPLFDPPGLAVQAFDEIGLGPEGALWWNISTDASDSAADEILYRNLSPIAQEGSAPFDPDQPLGTFWRDFDGFDFSSDGKLLVVGDVDSPAVFGTIDEILVRQTFDAGGILIDEETLLMEGDSLPGTNLLVNNIGTNASGSDVAHATDHWIAYITNSGGSSGNEIVMVDGVVVAQESKTGPLLGSVWGRLSSNAVDIVDSGDYVFRGDYTMLGGGTFEAIYLNAAPILTSGDTSDSLAPFAFDTFGRSTPLLLGENGNLVFYGTTDNPDGAKDQGYFLNDRFLVQEGVTTLPEGIVDKLITSTNGLEMSPSGRFVICQADLDSSSTVVMLFDLGLVQPMASSTVAAASLDHTDGLAVPGESLELSMDGEQDLGVTPFLLVSSAPFPGWSTGGSGLVTPFGELLIDIIAPNPVLVLSGPPSDLSAVAFSLAIPEGLGFEGLDFYAQGLFWDIGDQSPQENFRLTNGLQITIGR